MMPGMGWSNRIHLSIENESYWYTTLRLHNSKPLPLFRRLRIIASSPQRDLDSELRFDQLRHFQRDALFLAIGYVGHVCRKRRTVADLNWRIRCRAGAHTIDTSWPCGFGLEFFR